MISSSIQSISYAADQLSISIVFRVFDPVGRLFMGIIIRGKTERMSVAKICEVNNSVQEYIIADDNFSCTKKMFCLIAT